MRELQNNGRQSNKELAAKVGLSTAPCWQRLRRLERDGFIEGYTAILNLEMLNHSEIVLLEVQLEKHDKESLKIFGDAMSGFPEVLEVYMTTGEFDYFVKVAVTGTRDYERFLQDKLYTIPGIRNTRSVFTLRCHKREISIGV